MRADTPNVSGFEPTISYHLHRLFVIVVPFVSFTSPIPAFFLGLKLDTGKSRANPAPMLDWRGRQKSMHPCGLNRAFAGYEDLFGLYLPTLELVRFRF